MYDPVGGKLGEECLRSLRDDGQFIVIGFASGDIPKLPANQVLLRNRRVTGVDWGGWVGREPRGATRSSIGQVLAMIAAGELDPVEPVSYPFEQAAQALADQQQPQGRRQSVLVPSRWRRLGRLTFRYAAAHVYERPEIDAEEERGPCGGRRN